MVLKMILSRYIKKESFSKRNLIILLLICFLSVGLTSGTFNSLTQYNVTFNSDPSNVDIFIDGNWEGKTPKTILLSKGSHVVEITLQNYEGYIKKYNITGDYETEIKLNRIYNVTFNSVPSKVDIFIDGNLEGKTPKTIHLPEGFHEAEFIHPNYKIHSKMMVLKQDELYDVKLKKLIFTWDSIIYLLSIIIIVIGGQYVYFRHKIRLYNSKNIELLKDVNHKGEKVKNLGDKLYKYNNTEIKELYEKLDSTQKERKKIEAQCRLINDEHQKLLLKFENQKKTWRTIEEELKTEKSKVINLESEKHDLTNKNIKFKEKLDAYNNYFDIGGLPVEIRRGDLIDLKKSYNDFYNKKEVTRQVYALDEVLAPLFNAMRNVSEKADIKAIKNYPVYSQKQVFDILKDVELKLEKNPRFMQCLKAIKFRIK